MHKTGTSMLNEHKSLILTFDIRLTKSNLQAERHD